MASSSPAPYIPGPSSLPASPGRRLALAALASAACLAASLPAILSSRPGRPFASRLLTPRDSDGSQSLTELHLSWLGGQRLAMVGGGGGGGGGGDGAFTVTAGPSNLKPIPTATTALSADAGLLRILSGAPFTVSGTVSDGRGRVASGSALGKARLLKGGALAFETSAPASFALGFGSEGSAQATLCELSPLLDQLFTIRLLDHGAGAGAGTGTGAGAAGKDKNGVTGNGAPSVAAAGGGGHHHDAEPSPSGLARLTLRPGALLCPSSPVLTSFRGLLEPSFTGRAAHLEPGWLSLEILAQLRSLGLPLPKLPKGGGGATGGGGQLVAAELGPASVSFSRGVAVCERADVLLGGRANGIHLVTWGSARPSSFRVPSSDSPSASPSDGGTSAAAGTDVVALAIPASTLRRIPILLTLPALQESAAGSDPSGAGMGLVCPARARQGTAGAEKAAVAAASGFVVGAGAGYVATQDWRGLLWGLGGAALTGVATYVTKNSTPVAQ